MSDIKNQLLGNAYRARKEIETLESILNDGIDYDQKFMDQLHEEIRMQIKTLVRIKGILCKRYGIVAV